LPLLGVGFAAGFVLVAVLVLVIEHYFNQRNRVCRIEQLDSRSLFVSKSWLWRRHPDRIEWNKNRISQ
jgi:hypothetical protein